MSERVRLVLGGLDYEGWTGVRITRSIESGSGVFDLELTERSPLHPAFRRILPGEACSVLVGDVPMITGYVDEVEFGIDRESHSIRARGRDKVSDLIDCAPDLDPSEWTNQSLLDLAKRLARPFGITVRAEVPMGALFPRVAINAGETVWDLLEQLARYRQVLPISDGLGGVVFTRASASRLSTSLIEGQNILRASAQYSNVDRFSVYTVKGQSYDSGEDGDQSAGQASSGPIRDTGIKRYRPLLIVANSAVDAQQCIERARWEALTRNARSARAKIDVQGWRDGAGALWAINTRVSLSSLSLGLSGEFLISEASYELSESGTTTSLSLLRPDAFTVSPEREPPEAEEPPGQQEG